MNNMKDGRNKRKRKKHVTLGRQLLVGGGEREMGGVVGEAV